VAAHRRVEGNTQRDAAGVRSLVQPGHAQQLAIGIARHPHADIVRRPEGEFARQVLRRLPWGADAPQHRSPDPRIGFERDQIRQILRAIRRQHQAPGAERIHPAVDPTARAAGI
jgi:hypothetical protein